MSSVSVQGGTVNFNFYGLFVLAKPCPSLSTVLKLSIVVTCPVEVWWPCMTEGALRCFLYLFLNLLVNSPMYSITINPVTSVSVYCTTFALLWSLSFGNKNMLLIVLLPLMYALIPYLLPLPLMLLQRSCTYGITMYYLYVIFVVVHCVVWLI